MNAGFDQSAHVVLTEVATASLNGLTEDDRFASLGNSKSPLGLARFQARDTRLELARFDHPLGVAVNQPPDPALETRDLTLQL